MGNNDYSKVSTRRTEPKSFSQKFGPVDFIASLVILGGLGLMYLHINGIVGGLLISIIAYYFGRKETPPTAGI